LARYQWLCKCGTRLCQNNSAVINGCSELVLQLYGEDAGRHARTAMGVAATPFGIPVIIAAEVEISKSIIDLKYVIRLIRETHYFSFNL